MDIHSALMVFCMQTHRDMHIKNPTTGRYLSHAVYSNSNCHSSFSSAWGPDLAIETVIVGDKLKWSGEDVFFPLSQSRFTALVFPQNLERGSEAAYNALQEALNDII